MNTSPAMGHRWQLYVSVLTMLSKPNNLEVTAYSIRDTCPSSAPACSQVERRVAVNRLLGIGIGVAASPFAIVSKNAQSASAANIPVSMGADLSRTATVETLVPIVRMEKALITAKSDLLAEAQANSFTPATIKSVSKTIACIPTDQTLFKRAFDEYSDPVSYKQKFMDQNAFLVYYSKGFDGPDRPAMGTSQDSVPRQTLQYGARNDAANAMSDLFDELSFFEDGKSELADVTAPLERAISSFEAYLSYAPVADVDEARRQIAK
jgi:hypothetical protein